MRVRVRLNLIASTIAREAESPKLFPNKLNKRVIKQSGSGLHHLLEMNDSAIDLQTLSQSYGTSISNIIARETVEDGGG
jgi:hypothetical protein